MRHLSQFGIEEKYLDPHKDELLSGVFKRSIRVAFTQGRLANHVFEHNSGNLDLKPVTHDGPGDWRIVG